MLDYIFIMKFSSKNFLKESCLLNVQINSWNAYMWSMNSLGSYFSSFSECHLSLSNTHIGRRKREKGVKVEKEIWNYVTSNEIGRPTTATARRNLWFKMKYKNFSPIFLGQLKPRMIRKVATTDESEFPPAIYPEIAVVGRSNCGKSTLLNELVGRHCVARVNKKPGSTQELNFYQIGTPVLLVLVDMPGYGFAYNTKEEKRIYFTECSLNYVKSRKNLKRVFVLVDSRQGLKNADREMISFLERHNCKWQVVMTKCDLTKQIHISKRIQMIRDELKPCRYQIGRVIAVSALKKQGLDVLRNEINQLKLGTTVLRDNIKIGIVDLMEKKRLLKAERRKRKKELRLVNQNESSKEIKNDKISMVDDVVTTALKRWELLDNEDEGISRTQAKKNILSDDRLSTDQKYTKTGFSICNFELTDSDFDRADRLVVELVKKISESPMKEVTKQNEIKSTAFALNSPTSELSEIMDFSRVSLSKFVDEIGENKADELSTMSTDCLGLPKWELETRNCGASPIVHVSKEHLGLLDNFGNDRIHKLRNPQFSTPNVNTSEQRNEKFTVMEFNYDDSTRINDFGLADSLNCQIHKILDDNSEQDSLKNQSSELMDVLGIDTSTVKSNRNKNLNLLASTNLHYFKTSPHSVTFVNDPFNENTENFEWNDPIGSSISPNEKSRNRWKEGIMEKDDLISREDKLLIGKRDRKLVNKVNTKNISDGSSIKNQDSAEHMMKMCSARQWRMKLSNINMKSTNQHLRQQDISNKFEKSDHLNDNEKKRYNIDQTSGSSFNLFQNDSIYNEAKGRNSTSGQRNDKFGDNSHVIKYIGLRNLREIPKGTAKWRFIGRRRMNFERFIKPKVDLGNYLGLITERLDKKMRAKNLFEWNEIHTKFKRWAQRNKELAAECPSPRKEVVIGNYVDRMRMRLIAREKRKKKSDDQDDSKNRSRRNRNKRNIISPKTKFEKDEFDKDVYIKWNLKNNK